MRRGRESIEEERGALEGNEETRREQGKMFHHTVIISYYWL